MARNLCSQSPDSQPLSPTTIWDSRKVPIVATALKRAHVKLFHKMQEVDSINLNLARSVLCLKNHHVITQVPIKTGRSLKSLTTDPTIPPLSRMAVRNPAACNLSNPSITKVNLTPTSSRQLKVWLVRGVRRGSRWPPRNDGWVRRCRTDSTERCHTCAHGYARSTTLGPD
jgi:hypothetical protein